MEKNTDNTSLTSLRGEVNQIKKSNREDQITTVHMIQKKVDYMLKQNSYDATCERYFMGLSPEEIIDKLIQDISAIKQEINFQTIKEQYKERNEEKIHLEEEITKTQNTILDSLHTSGSINDLKKMPFSDFFGYGVAYRLKDEYENFENLIAFCTENTDRERKIMRIKTIGPKIIEKIKEIFKEYGVKI